MKLLVGLIFVFIAIIYLIYLIVTKKHNYWKNKNVPHITPLPILGNYAKYILLQEYIGELVQKLCKKFPDAPYFGAFYGTEPVLVVQSPELLKLVLTKDFRYFSGREISEHTDKEVVTKNLFFVGGDKWKYIHHSLTPLFTTGKMKNMFYLIEKYCHKFQAMLDHDLGVNNIVETKTLCGRYTMDCFISCAFGVESDTMDKPENNFFLSMAEHLLTSTNYGGFKMIFRSLWPTIFYGLGFKVFSTRVNTFFTNLLHTVSESRNHKPSTRNDFVDLLLRLKQDSDIISANITEKELDKFHLSIDNDVLAAQSVLFFAAGFESSASTFSFTLFELAKNPDAQKRAADEVDEFLRRRGNKLDYELVNELPYLEACMYEALRMYPVLGNLTREVMDNYTFPDGLRVDKGLRIHIPAYHLHHDPIYFPEPKAYKPERFMPENMINIRPYTFFPYGGGPRLCMGKRFAKMQVLPALLCVLKKYHVELADGMSTTINLESRSFLIQPREQGLMLRFTQRKGWEQRTFTLS